MQHMYLNQCSDMFCKPRVLTVSRWWCLCCYPHRQGALEVPWGLSHLHHPARHHHLRVLAPHSLAAAATQRLLKHRQSLICFTMANRNSVLCVYTSLAKSLGSLIILALGSGAPAEAQGNN